MKAELTRTTETDRAEQLRKANAHLRHELKVAREERDALRKEVEPLHKLADGARRWVSETSPGMRVNSAVGRHRTRMALRELDKLNEP